MRIGSSQKAMMGAAGAGGILEAEYGARMTSSSGGSLTNNYMIEMETSGTIGGKEAGNYFCMLGSHGTAMRLHLMSVNPSTLAVTHHDSYSVGSARDDRFGHGIVYNSYLGHIHVVLSYNNTFYAYSYEIDYANNAIQSLGAAQNIGSESSWYRAPNDCSQVIKANDQGYFLHFNGTVGGQTVARVIKCTSLNNWSTYSWSGNLWDTSFNNAQAIIRHPTQDFVFYALNNQSGTNHTRLGYIDASSISTINGNVYDNTFTNASAVCLMASDTKNLSTQSITGGNMLHTVQHYPNNNNYLGYGRYETSNSASTYYFHQAEVNLRPDTNYVQPLDQYYVEDGSSGNLCAVRGTYNGSSYSCDFYQMVYNDSEGWAGPQLIFSDGVSGGAYVSRGNGVYLSNADCSIMAYKDVYSSQWYARAFRGRRSS